MTADTTQQFALLVEDDPAFRQRFEALLLHMHAPRWRLAGSVGTLSAAIQLTRSDQAIDLLLVDLGLPDGSGIDVIRAVVASHPRASILVVTVFGDEEHVMQAIEAGAQGYLLKDSSPEEFELAIRDVMAGGSPISPIVARLVLRRVRGAEANAGAGKDPNGVALTQRENDILGLVAKGFSFADICGLLEISSNTLKTHIGRIYRKLAVHSRGEAVYEASRLGMLDL